MNDEWEDPEGAPAGYGRPAQPAGPDLSTCATMISSSGHCQRPVEVVMAIGCTGGEHAGHLSYCRQCAVTVSSLPSISCAQCLARGTDSKIKIYSRRDTDPEAAGRQAQSAIDRLGIKIVTDPDMPPGQWRLESTEP